MKNLYIFLIILLSHICLSETGVISVNFTHPSANDFEGTFGIASEGTEVGNWVNTITGQESVLPLSDGRLTGVSLTSKRGQQGNRRPTNWQYNDHVGQIFEAWHAAAGYNTATQDDYSHFVIRNLNETFPNGCKIIPYLLGDGANAGASISLTDGTVADYSTDSPYFYYKTPYNDRAIMNSPYPTDTPSGPASYNLIQATNSTITLQVNNSTVNPATDVQIANYAVFENVTADTVTLTIRAWKNNVAGLAGFQIVGEIDDSVVPALEDLSGNQILYNDFSRYLYDDLSIANSGGAISPTYHNKNNNNQIGGSSKDVYVKCKKNPYQWYNASAWHINHSFNGNFGKTNAVKFVNQAPSDSTGGTALRVGLSGPRKTSNSVLLNTGIKFDPALTYTVSIRAKVKDSVDTTITSNAIGNVSLSAGFVNLANIRNHYALINQEASHALTSTNWTELSVNIYGGNLNYKAIFGENSITNSFGNNGMYKRVPGNKLNLSNHFPQELMVSIGRSPNSTNTLDHITWIDWIKVETNNYLEALCSSYGLSSTNLLQDSDGDGDNDIYELTTGGDPNNALIQPAPINFINFLDVIRPIYETNNITLLPNQNDNGEIKNIISYPVTNFVGIYDAKYDVTTNLVANTHRFKGNTWTNYQEYVVSEEDVSNGIIKWKENENQIINLSVSNYVYAIDTLRENAHYASNNVYDYVTNSVVYTNYLDNGITTISDIFTNQIQRTYIGERSVSGYMTNQIARFKQPRSNLQNELGVSYNILSRDNLVFGQWTNSGAYNFGDTYNAGNYSNVIYGTSTLPASENNKFITIKVTSPYNDPSTHYFDTLPETDYGDNDPGY
jgi:hypothetical protein